MKCPKCVNSFEIVEVKVSGVIQKVKSFQCASCGHIEFDPLSSKKVISELNGKSNR